jgi:hypothetical protein
MSIDAHLVGATLFTLFVILLLWHERREYLCKQRKAQQTQENAYTFLERRRRKQ